MKKAQMILIAITAAFICVLLGIYIGRETSDGITLQATNDIIPQHTQANTDVSTGTTNTEPTKGTNSSTVIKNKLNINTATAEQLQLLDGIGAQIAANIIAYREENGPYKSVDDLLNVKLIGQKRLDAIIDYITVED